MECGRGTGKEVVAPASGTGQLKKAEGSRTWS